MVGKIVLIALATELAELDLDEAKELILEEVFEEIFEELLEDMLGTTLETALKIALIELPVEDTPEDIIDENDDELVEDILEDRDELTVELVPELTAELMAELLVGGGVASVIPINEICSRCPLQSLVSTLQGSSSPTVTSILPIGVVELNPIQRVVWLPQPTKLVPVVVGEPQLSWLEVLGTIWVLLIKTPLVSKILTKADIPSPSVLVSRSPNQAPKPSTPVVPKSNLIVSL